MSGLLAFNLTICLYWAYPTRLILSLGLMLVPFLVCVYIFICLRKFQRGYVSALLCLCRYSVLASPRHPTTIWSIVFWNLLLLLLLLWWWWWWWWCSRQVFLFSISCQSLAPRQKCPRNVVDIKKCGQLFCQWQRCGFLATVRDQKLFWSKFWVTCVL